MASACSGSDSGRPCLPPDTTIMLTPQGTRVHLITLGLVILTLALVQRLNGLVYEGGYFGIR